MIFNNHAKVDIFLEIKRYKEIFFTWLLTFSPIQGKNKRVPVGGRNENLRHLCQSFPFHVPISIFRETGSINHAAIPPGAH